MLALTVAITGPGEKLRARYLEVFVSGAVLESGADRLGAVEPHVVVPYLAVVVLGVLDPVVIVVVDTLEECRECLFLRGRDAIDARADDGSFVDLTEVEPERGRVAER